MGIPGPKTPEAIAKVTQNLPDTMPQEWQISEQGIHAIRTAVAMSNTKHGLVASIPIICKGDKCPYATVCTIERLRVKGEPCPLEIASILQRFEMYVSQFDIKPENLVDLGIVKNIVDIEIQLLRADKHIAISGDFIDNVVAAISPQGDAYYKPELGKAADFKLRLISEHSRLLSLMNATRKDKAGSKMSVTIDASTYAAELIRRKQELDRKALEERTIDVSE